MPRKRFSRPLLGAVLVVIAAVAAGTVLLDGPVPHSSGTALSVYDAGTVTLTNTTPVERRTFTFDTSRKRFNVTVTAGQPAERFYGSYNGTKESLLRAVCAGIGPSYFGAAPDTAVMENLLFRVAADGETVGRRAFTAEEIRELLAVYEPERVTYRVQNGSGGVDSRCTVTGPGSGDISVTVG
ncbi:MAG: hypothetical protein SVU88_04275 [Candidatus Nanohaloarchaea archaeon]|nr:hypothetical protein [Candidatus Nanohaloarchaea archaeon]